MSDNPNDWWFQFKGPDGKWWEVPVATIARNRAKEYMGEFPDSEGIPSLELSLTEDTLPIFREDDGYEIHDWSGNQMNWVDVKADARMAEQQDIPEPHDWQEAWMNGEKRIRRTD